jgi:hypothetical protein
MTKLEFAGVAAMLAAYYPTRVRLNDAGFLDAWFTELQDLDAQEVMVAVRQMARASDDWPSLALVRRLAQPALESAQAVWARTVATVCEYGPYGRWDSHSRQSLHPVWPGDIAAALERIGGSVAILEARDKRELDAMGRVFVQAIDESRQKRERQALATKQNAILPAPDRQEGVRSIENVSYHLSQKLKA